MDLHLSRNSVVCAVFSAVAADSDSTSGHAATPLYHIYTPTLLTRDTTTISRISPSVAHEESHKFNSDNRSDIKERTEYGEGVEEIARIHWKVAGTSRIVYNGQIHEVDKFLPLRPFPWWTRSFQGPDGRTYLWHVGQLTTRLTVEDGKNPPTEIARFHQALLSSFTGTALPTSKKPHLEIKPEGMHMVDLIVITFVFAEARRRDVAGKEM